MLTVIALLLSGAMSYPVPQWGMWGDDYEDVVANVEEITTVPGRLPDVVNSTNIDSEEDYGDGTEILVSCCPAVLNDTGALSSLNQGFNQSVTSQGTQHSNRALPGLSLFIL